MGSIFYYFDDSVRLQKFLVKFLASLPGIAKIDIVKKFVLFDLDVILILFSFVIFIGTCVSVCTQHVLQARKEFY